jgi:hypothetical protein
MVDSQDVGRAESLVRIVYTEMNLGTYQLRSSQRPLCSGTDELVELVECEADLQLGAARAREPGDREALLVHIGPEVELAKGDLLAEPGAVQAATLGATTIQEWV